MLPERSGKKLLHIKCGALASGSMGQLQSDMFIAHESFLNPWQNPINVHQMPLETQLAPLNPLFFWLHPILVGRQGKQLLQL